MSTALIVLGTLLVLVGMTGGFALVERVVARHRAGRLQVDRDVTRYMRRRSDEQRAAQQHAVDEARARDAKREG